MQTLQILLLLVPLSTSFRLTTTPRNDLNQIFTPKSGWSWLGGDSSSSIQLPNRPSDDFAAAAARRRNQSPPFNYLWIFGDTLRGKLVQNNTRDIKDMPHSTLALLGSSTTSTTTTPTFFFPTTTRGWFVPPSSLYPSTSYYWLIDGVVGHDTGRLFLQAMVINGTPDGFVQLGTDLIVVDMASSSATKSSTIDPTKWTSISHHLPHTVSARNHLLLCSS